MKWIIMFGLVIVLLGCSAEEDTAVDTGVTDNNNNMDTISAGNISEDGAREDIAAEECGCFYREATIITSDNEEYVMAPGKSAYTAAGALEWAPQTGKFCRGNETVPIKVTAKKYGEVVDEKMITLGKGQTSDVLTHPTMSQIRFTLKVADLNTECR